MLGRLVRVVSIISIPFSTGDLQGLLQMLLPRARSVVAAVAPAHVDEWFSPCSLGAQLASDSVDILPFALDTDRTCDALAALHRGICSGLVVAVVRRIPDEWFFSQLNLMRSRTPIPIRNTLYQDQADAFNLMVNAVWTAC